MMIYSLSKIKYLTVEKNGKEKKIMKVSFAYFSFQKEK